MPAFIAHAVAVEELEDLNTFLVCLAEHPDGAGVRVELQRALEFDEQDVRLGMDTYCLVTEEGAAHYGGITSWQLEPQRLVLRLEPGAAQVLGIDEEYTIELKISDERIQILRDGLMRVLASD